MIIYEIEGRRYLERSVSIGFLGFGDDLGI
jgi:hypothetical protein